MENRIDDQLKVSKFYKVLEQSCFYDVASAPTAIIKGPIATKKLKMDFTTNDLGERQTNVVQRIEIEFQRVNPRLFFPANGAVDVDKSNLIEVASLSLRDLNDMKGTPGVHDSEIDRVMPELCRYRSLK